MLAALLLDASRVVPVGRLIDTLWGPAAPRTARITTQNRVMRLRQALGDAGRERISTRPPGYLISLEPGELDVTRFEEPLVVAGASGVGKSSLLQAGVLPRLREAGLPGAPGASAWPHAVFTPGRAPLDELAVRVAPLAGAACPTCASRPDGRSRGPSGRSTSTARGTRTSAPEGTRKASSGRTSTVPPARANTS